MISMPDTHFIQFDVILLIYVLDLITLCRCNIGNHILTTSHAVLSVKQSDSMKPA